jgi:methylmalonyl-CoA mutase, C-terminal domain
MKNKSPRIKVLLAKPGLDGHDRGILVLAQGLKDAGMEVVYTGIRQSPLDIVTSALQEDVDVIGVSCLSGAHLVLCRDILHLLKKNKAQDKIVFCGGIIPIDDHAKLKRMGVRAVFTPGTSMVTIVQDIQKHVRA